MRTTIGSTSPVATTRPTPTASPGPAPTPTYSPTVQNGPAFVHLSAGYTPQGQGYDARRQQVLTTYYRDHRVLLSVQSTQTGAEVGKVGLGGAPPPSHGGGVATDGKRVYVSDTERVYVYRREDLKAAAARGVDAQPVQQMEVPRGDVVDRATGMPLVSAGSYMTVHGGYAYVGGYSKDGDGKAGAVWRYKLDESGRIDEASRQGPVRAPDRAQGMTVVNGAMLFTTGEQKLYHQPFSSTTFTADVYKRTEIGNGHIAPYAQGLNVVGDELWVSYESGSSLYKSKVDDPIEHIQRIPLSLLDLGKAGLRVTDLQPRRR